MDKFSVSYCYNYFYYKHTCYDAIALGHSKDYAPFQPIKFSHAVHAGQNGTDCIIVIVLPHIAKLPVLPPENVCMNCHLMVTKWHSLRCDRNSKNNQRIRG